MFDKIPSLKDFIIYFMPGVLICFFSGDLISQFSSADLLLVDIANNSVLIFIGIVVSFLVGFLLSQAQIILFNKILEKKLKPKQTIEGIGWPSEIQNSLMHEINKRVNIPDTIVDLKKDEEIVFFCQQFVLLKTNEKELQYIDRPSHLASFACGMFFPVILGLIDLFLYLEWKACWIVWGVILIGGSVSILILNIIYNFKKGWYADIFRRFLVFSKSEG